MNFSKRSKTCYAPKRLRPGDKVALVAPASPFKSDELAESLDIMTEVGLVPVFGDNVRRFKVANVYAASLTDRVDELMWAFSDPDIKGVVAVTGGNGSAGLLPYIDYDVIARHRKPFLGMSDNTALNNGILTHAALVTINGQSPNIRLDKGRTIRDADTASFFRTLELMMSDEEWNERPFDINQFLPRTLSSGKARGIVVGGNCDTFVHLLGTSFVPDLSATMLFIEDVHKDGQTLARQFLHLRLAGVLDSVAGIVIGEFADVPKRNCNERSPGIEDVLNEYFSDGPPCVYGFSFSHGPWTIPIPIGASCTMDADAGTVSFQFAMEQ